MAVGNMSLVDCPMLTWSLGWIGFFSAKRSPPRHFDGPVADDLVGVHVRRGAGAGLVDVDGKLGVELAGGHFARRGNDGFGDLGFELAEVAVGHRRGRFDETEGADQARRQRLAGDRKVLDGALGLSAVIGLRGDLDLAHGVFFNSEFAHCILRRQALLVDPGILYRRANIGSPVR